MTAVFTQGFGHSTKPTAFSTTSLRSAVARRPFLGDKRIATTIRNPDGSRAIGTSLARGPAYDAIFRDGQSYRGEGEILGEGYLTAYDPIKTPGGELVGIVFVGVKLADAVGVANRVTRDITLLASLVVLLGAVGLWIVSRRLLKPIGQMTNVMQRLARDETDVMVPGLGRRDEIGRMAAAVDVFRENANERHRLTAEQRAAEERVAADKHRLLDRLAEFPGERRPPGGRVCATFGGNAGTLANVGPARRRDHPAVFYRLRRCSRGVVTCRDGRRGRRATVGFDCRDWPAGWPSFSGRGHSGR
ncbi:MAG: cache domain-containing protein [Rhodospirillales bacterium]|nr:cache domain-containing protein [Rhodospirillales bacterium]